MTTKTMDPEIATETLVAPAEAPPKPLKLSEALRLGSMNTVQLHGGWSRKTDEGGVAKMCAISTAWYALTGEDGGADSSPLTHLLDDVRVKHPIQHEWDDLVTVIINLNDSHQWSRAQISDWLEGLGL